MNETTLFLAQIMGPTLAVIGLGILFNKQYYAKVYKGIGKEPLAVLMMSMTLMVVGIVMVRTHFLWGSVAESLVTLVGLGVLIKGALFALTPKAFEKLIDSILTSGLISFGGLLWVICGAYLSYVAYLI